MVKSKQLHESVAPPINSRYYTVELDEDGMVYQYVWKGSKLDLKLLADGMIFLSKPAAVKRAKEIAGVADVKNGELFTMETAPHDEMILLDVGLGFFTVGHWNDDDEAFVYASLNCNDSEGKDTYFENEYMRAEHFRGWLPLPRVG